MFCRKTTLIKKSPELFETVNFNDFCKAILLIKEHYLYTTFEKKTDIILSELTYGDRSIQSDQNTVLDLCLFI